MGATAVGKTAYCIRQAQAWNTEVISADSRQFYREMQIGTARPMPDELAGVPHHFLGSHSIHSPLTVGDYEAAAMERIRQLFRHHDRLILTGGSGLYLRAVYHGLDPVPPSDPSVRAQLNQRLKNEGLTALVRELRAADPVYAARTDLNNPRRVIRALEVWQVAGKPFSAFHNQKPAKPRPFRVEKVVLDRPRSELYERINRRVERMIEDGLVAEAKRLYPHRRLSVLQTVGYQELFPYLEGAYPLEEAIRRIQQNTRRYAKRQLTWFRREQDAKWVTVY